MIKIKILFLEDDTIIASGLIYSLNTEGYDVVHTESIASAKRVIEENKFEFDLGILDMSLPDGNGFEICDMLKSKNIPVIFLSAIDDEGNIVKALEIGGDDYVTKPFRIRELIARIKNVSRRINNKEESKTIIIKNIKIDIKKAKVFKNNEEIFLTTSEYKLFLMFINNLNIVLTRNQLLDSNWDFSGNFVNDNTLTVYIKRLREKIEDDPSNPQIIKTIRGLGYKVGD